MTLPSNSRGYVRGAAVGYRTTSRRADVGNYGPIRRTPVRFELAPSTFLARSGSPCRLSYCVLASYSSWLPRILAISHAPLRQTFRNRRSHLHLRPRQRPRPSLTVAICTSSPMWSSRAWNSSRTALRSGLVCRHSGAERSASSAIRSRTNGRVSSTACGVSEGDWPRRCLHRVLRRACPPER